MVPNKRIKLDTRDRQRNAIILSEIDIELGLRKRLAQTLESRIAWASLLLQSLTNETDCTSEVSFKDVALNTLSILESSSDILFARDIIEVPSQNTATKSRPPPKEKPITRSQKSKFLYLRSQDSRRVILLRCAICHQSTFNTLQGLFNHGRILHSTDWGTHEECVKACAVLHEEPETQVDLEGGVDVGRGMLPGVKSLFQMAVEGTRDRETNGAYSELGSEEVAHRSIHLTKTLGLHSDSPALAQFLGKEAKRKIIKVWDDGGQIDITSFIDDDPQALKKPRWKKTYTHRNCPEIKEEITFNNRNSRLTTAGSSSQVPNSAITVSSRFHVSCRVTLTDSSLFIPEDQRIEEKKDHTHQWMICAESASYSLDLTTALTSMTVTPISPSELEYSVSFHPLVATEPPFLVVGTTSEPFQARVELMFNPSTSGPGQNGQKVILEHWVGLDMIGTNKLPTKGDEQVVDIELDKDTVLKPAKTGYVSLKAKSHWENVLNVKLGTESKPAVADVAPPEPTIPGSYTELLQSLVASFPMTLKDIPQNNPKLAPNIPYRLPTDYNQFKTLIIGRQKAIEWARAKALQHAYTNHIQVLRKRYPCSHLVPLTTGDVYAWMEDYGHFIREEPKTKHVNVLDSQQDDVLTVRDYSEGRWCRVCGLGLWAHGTRGSDYIQTETELAAATKESEENQLRLPKIRLRLLNGEVVGGGGPNAPPSPPKPQPFQCQIVVKMLQLLKMPIVDVYRIFRLHTEKETEQISPTASLLNPRQLPPWSSRTYRLVRDHSTVVSAVDPRMILGIRSVVHALHLPSFQQLTSSPMAFPLDQLGQTATEVEANLSPYALLALAARQFIRVLIKEAAEIEKRDKELGVGLLFESHHRDVSVLASGPSGKKYKTAHGTNAGKKGREKDKIKLQSIKVLTPMHIITGVVSNYVRATALASMPSEGRSSIGYEGGVGMAMFGCLSRIGVSVQEEREL